MTTGPIPESTPVEVTNVVKTESTNPEQSTTKPTSEKVVETHETVRTSGTLPEHPNLAVTAADDNARKWLAFGVIAQFLGLVGFMVYLTLKSGTPVDPAQMMILGAEIGFVTTVLNYYFGSSSGSTAKSLANVEKK